MPTKHSKFILRGPSCELEVERFTLRNWGLSREYQMDLTLLNPSRIPDVSEAVCFQLDDVYFHGYIDAVAESLSDQIHEVTIHIISPLGYFLDHLHTHVYSEQSLDKVLWALLSNAGLKEGVQFDLKLKTTEKVWYVQDKESSLSFLQKLLFNHGIAYCYEQSDSKAVCIFSDSISLLSPTNACTIQLQQLSGMEGEEGVAEAAFKKMLCTEQLSAQIYEADRAQVLESSTHSAHAYAIGNLITHPFTFQQARSQLAQSDEKAAELHLTLQAIAASPGQAVMIENPFVCSDPLYVKEITINGRQKQLRGVRKTVCEDTECARLKVCMILTPCFSGLPDVTPALFAPGNTFHTATVEQAFGIYPELSQEGEYRIRLHLDETPDKSRSLYNNLLGDASNQIRNALYFGGNNYGFSFPLENKTEVMIAYENGNATRPIILGALPNKANPSVVKNENKNESIIRTKSGNLMQITAGQDDCLFELGTEDAENQLRLIQGKKNNSFFLQTRQGRMSIDAMRFIHLKSIEFHQLSQGNQDLWADGNTLISAGNGEAVFNSLTLGTISSDKNMNFDAEALALYAAKNASLDTTTQLVVSCCNRLSFKARQTQTWKLSQGVMQLKARNSMKIKGGGSMLIISPVSIALQTSGILQLNGMTIAGI